MKKRVTIAAIAAVVIIVIVVAIVINRRPLRRRTIPVTEKPTAASTEKALVTLPLAQWTDRVSLLQRRGDWTRLVDELDAVQAQQEKNYSAHRLDYLHARAALEANELDRARELLQPFLAKEHPLRLRALVHAIDLEVADGEDERAALLREELIFAEPGYRDRDELIDSQLAWLDEEGKPEEVRAFAQKIRVTAEKTLQRDLDARLVEADVRTNRYGDAITRGAKILLEDIRGDAADRVFRALDKPEIIAQLAADVLLALGEAAKEHRHFDRAVPILALARTKNPARFDDLTFSIGRAQFGGETYPDAQKTYVAGAARSTDAKWKSTFLYHAARAAQLQGNDKAAEELMTASLAIKGKFPSTAAAVTQRLRTRLAQKRFAEAQRDLAQIGALFPNERSVLESSLAYGVALVAANRMTEADNVLNSIPMVLRDPYDRAEISYWRARTFEGRDVVQASSLYLEVLRSSTPTHFAYFARERLTRPPLSAAIAKLLTAKSAEVDRLVAAKEWNRAREAQTDVVLLDPSAPALAKLRTIYLEIPAYRAFVELKAASFPRIGEAKTVEDTLMALGLYDEAVSAIKARYPTGGNESALAQSIALNRAGESRDSILAVEILMKRVPSDFVPELLPRTVLELLYPRYFYDTIATEAERHDADPRLVLSIMREESRFNPRAKSVAAARGLLQFIITTARDVGHSLGIVELDPEDLYDPHTIIRLGAKYIGDLLETFGGNAYHSAAAYNAGPYQTKLWKRMAPAADNDYFLSSVNFDETKHYVRKVLNSYWRYGEIYENARPPAGTRAEP